MTKQEIFNTIQPWIAEKLGVDPSEVTMEADLEKDLGAESLDKAEMPFDLEEMFGVDINAYFDKLFNEYPDNYIRTVGDMVTLVETLQNGNDSGTITQTKNAGATNPQTGSLQTTRKQTTQEFATPTKPVLSQNILQMTVKQLLLTPALETKSVSDVLKTSAVRPNSSVYDFLVHVSNQYVQPKK